MTATFPGAVAIARGRWRLNEDLCPMGIDAAREFEITPDDVRDSTGWECAEYTLSADPSPHLPDDDAADTAFPRYVTLARRSREAAPDAFFALEHSEVRAMLDAGYVTEGDVALYALNVSVQVRPMPWSAVGCAADL